MKLFRILIVTLSVLISSVATAEVVVLNSGKRVSGTVLVQNEQVVIVQDAEGRRFQFPANEVTEIVVPETEEPAVVEAPVKTEYQSNCALRLDLSGGALFVPTLGNGGYGSVDLQIGTRRIGNRSVFLGGSVGYQAAVSDKSYHFLPLMVAFSMPLIEGKHAPEVGAALGYGFAIKRPSSGGMVAKLDISWRYQYQRNSALLLGVQARWQQAKVSYMETITEKDQNGEITYNQDFNSTLGKNFVSVGLRLAIQF